MNVNEEWEKITRDTQTLGIFTAFVLAAASEPGLDRASFIARVEGTFAKMEANYDKNLLEMARIVLHSIKAP